MKRKTNTNTCHHNLADFTSGSNFVASDDIAVLDERHIERGLCSERTSGLNIVLDSLGCTYRGPEIHFSWLPTKSACLLIHLAQLNAFICFLLSKVSRWYLRRRNPNPTEDEKLCSLVIYCRWSCAFMSVSSDITRCHSIIYDRKYSFI